MSDPNVYMDKLKASGLTAEGVRLLAPGATKRIDCERKPCWTRAVLGDWSLITDSEGGAE